MITLELKYGKMTIEVERIDSGFQRVARYSLAKHSKLAGKTLTSRGKVYKTERGARQEAEKFADQQARLLS